MFMMYDQSTKSPPRNLPMGSSGESDEDKHCHPSFAHTQVAKTSRRGNNQHYLDRWERALCRVLVQHHGISRNILHDYFGCAQSTISKAVDNHYAQPDRTENDDEILLSGRNFDAILKKILKMKQGFARKKSRFGGHQHAYSEPARQRNRGSKTHTVSSSSERKANLPRLIAMESARNPSTPKAPSPTAPRVASSPGPFLKKFVAKLPLDEGWYKKLKNAGFDEGKLRHFAGLQTEKIEKFIEKTFPEMSAVARFLLVTAIEGVAI
ncbi:hypothetical protein DFH08DRAFT_806936 [Mycena albidolilacea]|uniref:Uncharacterized protein n=1 Tax=Mycena albidolilacea TaxID=1033008 RepID=A0AAD7A4V9_9AGAR|nr:hypothetical protein DFH08DRAFT_806936 [Mycena albidolilacea]